MLSVRMTDEAGASAANARSDQGRRWTPIAVASVGAVAVAVVLGLLIWRPWGGTGDPGGRILAQLKPVAYALPPGSHVNYRHLVEPHQDSCDGNPATRGWSQVVAQTNFDWSGSPQQLVDIIKSRMQALGWSFSPATDNGLPAGQWTKTLTGGTTAGTALGVEAGGSAWTLLAIAPPVGRPAAGC